MKRPDEVWIPLILRLNLSASKDTKKKLTSGGFVPLKSLRSEWNLRWGPIKVWNFIGQALGFSVPFGLASSMLLRSYKISELKPKLNIAFKQKHPVLTGFRNSISKPRIWKISIFITKGDTWDIIWLFNYQSLNRKTRQSSTGENINNPWPSKLVLVLILL